MAICNFFFTASHFVSDALAEQATFASICILLCDRLLDALIRGLLNFSMSIFSLIVQKLVN